MDSELSYEMIMEIISRSSLKTLDTMRCASKELNTLTYESYLFDLYKKRNKIVSGFLIQYLRRGWIYTNEFVPSPESSSLDLGIVLPHNAKILATSEQGIIVFHNCEYTGVTCKEVYQVCKPTTNQVLTLPNPKVEYKSRQFAIVVMSLKPLHYKIIRFSESDRTVVKRWGKFYGTYQCEIFDSLAWEWRSLSQIRLPFCVHLTNPQPITKGGSIYMLLSNNTILKFDMYSEKWEVFPSPIPYDESGYPRSFVELVKYGGRLGMASKPIHDPNGRWEIWVLTMDQSWEKMYICKRKEDRWEFLKALCDLDTSVMLEHNTLVFYRFKQEGNNMISKVMLKDTPSQIFFFRSDFEPIDLI